MARRGLPDQRIEPREARHRFGIGKLNGRHLDRRARSVEQRGHARLPAWRGRAEQRGVEAEPAQMRLDLLVGGEWRANGCGQLGCGVIGPNGGIERSFDSSQCAPQQVVTDGRVCGLWSHVRDIIEHPVETAEQRQRATQHGAVLRQRRPS